MGLLETFRTAFESIVANRMRSLLTMLGVIIGTMAVVLLLALGEGVQNYFNQQFATFGSNQITVSPDNSVAGARLTNNDVKAIRDSVAGAKRVVPQVSGNLNVVANGTGKSFNVVGTIPENFAMRTIGVQEGALFSDADNDARLRVAVVGYQAAIDLFGSQPAVGQTILVNSVPFKVAGVTEKKGSAGPQNSSDDTVYVPLTVAQEKLFPNRNSGVNSVNQITVEAIDGNASTQVTQAIAEVLRRQHNILFGQKDDFRVFDQSSTLSTINGILTALQIFLAAIGAIALLVGGIGIMNIMLVSVTERTREIGVRKAIGATPGSIRLQFLVEALVVTLLAGIIGVLLASGLSAVIAVVQDFITPVVQANAVIVAVGVSVFIGVVFGFYPAFRASRLQPVEALRYE
jgi:putative ABC transport system permease protein